MAVLRGLLVDRGRGARGFVLGHCTSHGSANVSPPPYFPRVSAEFFSKRILNSPKRHPGKHWEPEESGQPTGRANGQRRRALSIAPISRAEKQFMAQRPLVLDDWAALPTSLQDTVGFSPTPCASS